MNKNHAHWQDDETDASSEDEDDWFDTWDKKVNSERLSVKYSGLYYQFQTPDGLQYAGSDGPQIVEDTPCILTSCSKVFTSMAMMRTMHLRPRDWYPQKFMHEFAGWENWRDFAVLDNQDNTDGKRGWSGKKANVNVHQLLTHTSGWPFGLRGTRERIRMIPLYFEPGTAFGYSIGHRILGWMLLDYWQAQPEGLGFQSLTDVFKFLVYDPLNLSPGTYLIKGHFENPHSIMGEFFDMNFFDIIDDDTDDDPGDLALASTGADMMKVAMVALRRGQLPDGSWYISQQQWNAWAAKNQLPDGKLSTALAHWRMESFDDVLPWRTMITRDTNAGPFGWSYFGATYHNYTGEDDAGEACAIGWKGFTSCGLRADYEQNIAFVAMQECIPDPGNRNFAECIHQGKVGDYPLGFVGRQLANMNPEEIEEMQSESKHCICNPFQCCHDLNVELDDPPCLVTCGQSILRCFYKLSLPCLVSLLDYHKREELDAHES